MNKIALIVAASAAIFSSASFAQGYVGGALARTALDLDCDGTVSCEESATGFKLFGGYAFGNGFAVEGSYISFGTQNVRALNSVDFKAHSFGIGAAYRYNFTPKWQAAARLGLARNTFKTSDVAGTESESKIQPTFGIGGSYKVLPKLSIDASLDFTRFKFDGETRAASLLGVGATFSF
ncbi:MAG: hypothetical protein RLZZ618_800 [Pseudomonadota bacterium]|jgi:OOP family OmpA-OmpF porin